MTNNITNQSQKSNNNQDDKIDFIQLAKTLWEGRKTVIKTILIFMAIGLIIAIFSPKEYTASSTFVSQTRDEAKIDKNLGALAAIEGINLVSMSSASGISPELYPQIIKSIPFQLELLQTPLTIDGQIEKVTYTYYYSNIHSPGLLGYIKKYTIGLPALLIKGIKGKPKSITNLSSRIPEIQSITIEEHGLINQMKNQLGLIVNKKEGYVTISANMPEAIASAELAYKAEKLLQQYVIAFKIKKSNDQLDFIKARYLETGKRFKAVQQKLALQRDRNKYLTTALAKTASEILQDEYNLIYGVYTELAKLLEAQYIQVTEDTPVFTVLEPVSIPIEKSKPKRGVILIIWIFSGGIIGVGMVFGKTFVLDAKKQWNE